MTIAERLKEERERLGLSQPRLGGLTGVVKQTVIQWEKGASAPDAVQISAFADAGADVLYILTGVRAAAPVLAAEQVQAGYAAKVLSKKEQVLLEKYRAATPKIQDATQTLLDAATQCDNRRAG